MRIRIQELKLIRIRIHSPACRTSYFPPDWFSRKDFFLWMIIWFTPYQTHTIPNQNPFQNECTPQTPFVQIILAAKWLVWHSSTTTSDDLCLLFCLHPSSSMTSSNQKKEKKFRIILSSNRPKILSQEKIRKVCRTCYHKKYADRF